MVTQATFAERAPGGLLVCSARLQVLYRVPGTRTLRNGVILFCVKKNTRRQISTVPDDIVQAAATPSRLGVGVGVEGSMTSTSA